MYHFLTFQVKVVINYNLSLNHKILPCYPNQSEAEWRDPSISPLRTDPVEMIVFSLLLKQFMLKIAKLLLIINWSILISKFLVLPLPTDGDCGFLYCDKVVHLFLFAILFLFLFIFFTEFISFRSSLLISLFLSSLYGAVIEYIQKYFPDRFFAYGDMFFNFLGGLLVLIILVLFYRRKFLFFNKK